MALVIKKAPANAGRRKRHRFDPWVQKISLLEEGVILHFSILARESYGQRSLMGYHHRVSKSKT